MKTLSILVIFGVLALASAQFPNIMNMFRPAAPNSAAPATAFPSMSGMMKMGQDFMHDMTKQMHEMREMMTNMMNNYHHPGPAPAPAPGPHHY